MTCGIYVNVYCSFDRFPATASFIVQLKVQLSMKSKNIEFYDFMHLRLLHIMYVCFESTRATPCSLVISLIFSNLSFIFRLVVSEKFKI